MHKKRQSVKVSKLSYNSSKLNRGAYTLISERCHDFHLLLLSHFIHVIFYRRFLSDFIIDYFYVIKTYIIIREPSNKLGACSNAKCHYNLLYYL